MKYIPIVNKARKIYDLNNVPLVTGVSQIKWHLPHSISGEHRGRTPKCPIANHRVEYEYGKLVPVRIAIDRNNTLAECPMEFEVLQEFGIAGAGGGRDEKMTLGIVRLNLSEYVEESEAIMRGGGSSASAGGTEDSPIGRGGGGGMWPSFSPGGMEPLVVTTTPGGGSDRRSHGRKRSSQSGIASIASSSINAGVGGGLSAPNMSPRSSRTALDLDEEGSTTATASATAGGELVEEGVVRRYLMQESKINSTLKLSILMVQIDGERSYIAPPLKTAPVFGGIAGFMAGDSLDLDPAAAGGSTGDGAQDPMTPNAFGGGGGGAAAAVSGDGVGGLSASLTGKARDTSEFQDMYRRALAASWACQVDELPADECIEDIFAGGDGFRGGFSPPSSPRRAGISAGIGSGSGHGTSHTSKSPRSTHHPHAHAHSSHLTASSASVASTATRRPATATGSTRSGKAYHHHHTLPLPRPVSPRGGSGYDTTGSQSASASDDEDEDEGDGDGEGEGGEATEDAEDLYSISNSNYSNQTLRPRDLERTNVHLRPGLRQHSSTSDRIPGLGLSGIERRGGGVVADHTSHSQQHQHQHEHNIPRREGLHSRSDSTGSMTTTTLGSSERERGTERDHHHLGGRGGGGGGGGGGFKRAREVNELDVREDLVAWKVGESRA